MPACCNASLVCVTSEYSSLLVPGVAFPNQSPLIYSSVLAAEQGGHLDFRSHCTVRDLPDPELFSSQTCCWCICRKRTIIFCAITEIPKKHWLCFRLFTVQLSLFQRGYRLARWSSTVENWRTTMGERERSQLQPLFSICPDMAHSLLWSLWNRYSWGVWLEQWSWVRGDMQRGRIRTVSFSFLLWLGECVKLLMN